MKKLLSLIAVLVTFCACAFGLTACGDVSVTGAYVDGNGNLIMKYDDGKEKNCGAFNGEESLNYRLGPGKDLGCFVTGAEVTDGEIVIPSEHKGLPVLGIDEGAFYGCDDLTKVSLSGNVKSIGKNAFSKCENLKKVSVESVESWCNISFANMAANPMYFATEFCVAGELVEDLVITDGVTAIPDFAFYECSNIKSVSIGEGVTEIGKSAFYGCGSLESADINGNIAVMGENVFADCTSLKTLRIGNGVGIIGNYAFLRCGLTGEINCPSSVKSIGEGAFLSCESLQKVTFNEGLESIGDSAFSGCISLDEFNMPSTVTEIGFGVVMFGGSSGFDPIGNVSNQVGKITMSDKITEIPDYAFSFCGITEMTVGESVEKIGYSAFYGCEQLESVVIPKSVKSITSYAFYRCSTLNTVYYKGNAEEWSAVKIGRNGNAVSTAEIYFYSETQPAEEGNYWHYGADGKTPLKW